MAVLLPRPSSTTTMNGDAAPRRQPRSPHGAARRLPRRRRGSLGRDRGRDDEDWQRSSRSSARRAGEPTIRHPGRAQAHEDELEARLTRWTTTLPSEEATRRLQAAGVAAFPAMTNHDLAEDPHLNGREFFVDVPHPEVGKRHHAGIPWKLSQMPAPSPPPRPVSGSTAAKSSAKSSATPNPRSKRSPPTACSVDDL